MPIFSIDGVRAPTDDCLPSNVQRKLIRRRYAPPPGPIRDNLKWARDFGYLDTFAKIWLVCPSACLTVAIWNIVLNKTYVMLHPEIVLYPNLTSVVSRTPALHCCPGLGTARKSVPSGTCTVTVSTLSTVTVLRNPRRTGRPRM